MLAIGVSFIESMIEGQSVRLTSDVETVVVDFDQLIIQLRMLGYNCSAEDRTELAIWFRNQDLYSKGP